MIPAFPKPGQVKKKPVAVRVFSDGREVCNLLTKEGRDIYSGRKKEMWVRQDRACCLKGLSPMCMGRLPGRNGRIAFSECEFDHENGRTAGKRDDRIQVEEINEDGEKVIRIINGVCCSWCNAAKGSRRIQYNDAP